MTRGNTPGEAGAFAVAGARVRVRAMPRLRPFAGRTGVIEEPEGGVDGRHRIRFDRPAGMHTHADLHTNELEPDR